MGFQIKVSACQIVPGTINTQTPLAQKVCEPEIINLINLFMNEYLENKIVHEFNVHQGKTFMNKW